MLQLAREFVARNLRVALESNALAFCLEERFVVFEAERDGELGVVPQDGMDVEREMRAIEGEIVFENLVEHSPADLVCIVRAGTTLADLAAELARHGQRWPVDVADPERATVGGTIASAAWTRRIASSAPSRGTSDGSAAQ